MVEEEMRPGLNIKDNLQNYLPSLLLLLNDKYINWDKVNAKYLQELNDRFVRLAAANEAGIELIEHEACLFDIISRVVRGDSSFLNLFNFFDGVLKSLVEKTTEEEKRLLRDTVYYLLTNLDKNYLNFIGELAVLNNLKTAGFELLNTEQPLIKNDKDSTRIDFAVKKNNKILLVEIYNLHLPDAAKLNDSSIEQRLVQKITGKLNKKQKGSDKVFYLVPVLWGEYDAIKLVNDYYQRSKIEFPNTLYPSAMALYTTIDGKVSKSRFGTIDKLILKKD